MRKKINIKNSAARLDPFEAFVNSNLLISLTYFLFSFLFLSLFFPFLFTASFFWFFCLFFSFCYVICFIVRLFPFKIESDQIKRLTTNWYRLQFYNRNPFKKLSSHFTLEIPLKNLFIFSEGANFTKEIPLIFFFEKNQPWNYASKIPSRTVKLEIIFSKNHRSSVILKIVENFSNLMTKLNPQEFWRKLWL